MEICLCELLEKEHEGIYWGTWDQRGVLVNLKKKCYFFFFLVFWNYMHYAKILMKRIFIAHGKLG